MSASRSALYSSSTTARRETTTLLRFWSNLISLNSSSLFSKYAVSRTGRTSTKEPGKKARMSLSSTTKPPFTLPVIIPVTISSLLKASSKISHARKRRAFSRDKRVSPKPSSTVSSATSTKSPTRTVISPRSFLNCSAGITPSDFKPALTITKSGRTSRTVAFNRAPGCIWV